MKPWALVPVKRFDQGKSRLGEVLDAAARADLARTMFDRVVGRALGELVRRGEIGGTLVVTDSAEVEARSRSHGARAALLPGTGPGRALGAIVDEGLGELAAGGAGAALVIMGDLPRLEADDVRALAALLEGHDVALAPDAAGTGTNALAMRLPAPMPTRFRGGESLGDHLDEARARGLRVALCERPGFQLDVDLPEDYERIRRSSTLNEPARGPTMRAPSPQERLMATFPETHQDLLKTETKAFAFLATVQPDGTPQVTPVWFDTSDGKVRINTARGRVKDRNMQKNASVAIAIMDPTNPYRYLQVRGKVSNVTEEGADDHINSLAKKYLGQDTYPFRQPGEQRVIFEIEPTSFQKMG